jgi:importin subunit beta-1
MRYFVSFKVDLSIITPHLQHVLTFLDILSKDPNLTDAVLSATCGLIGDLVSCFGTQLIPAIDNESITNILNKGKKSKNNRTKTLANWASKEIRKLKNIS